MSTPQSANSPTPYCSIAQLLLYHDARGVGDCINDDGTRATTEQVLASATVQAMLDTASGQVESALYACERYVVPDDLTTLTGVSQQLLVALIADLAYWYLVKRRYPTASPDKISGAQSALDQLERLRKGENILGLQEVAESGLPDVHPQSPGEIASLRRNTILAGRFFGRRSNMEQS